MWKTVCLICYLLVLSIYDIRTRKIPVLWLGIGGVAALVNFVCLCLYLPLLELWPEVIKSWGPGILMLAVGKLSGKIGSGDGSVLLVTGSILGSVKITKVFAGSLLLAAVTAAALLMLRKVRKNDKIPFMPFLTVSVILLEVV